MEFEIIDDCELVTCRFCGKRQRRIYGEHLKSHGLTSKMYIDMYPESPLMAKSDKDKLGKHMKDEKYKKMFSKMFSGEKNPNHKTKTTEEVRKSRSPFSKNFTGYQDKENKEEIISNFVKTAIKNRITSTQLDYYIQMGYSEDESIELLKRRQRTFTIEKCIEKWGEEKGREVYVERQNKWQKSLLENGNIKCGYSLISQELFFEIMNNYKDKYELTDVFFAVKNKEFFISLKESGFFIYDFCDVRRKKIIEYNGDNYHANPKLFKPTDKPHPYLKENGPTSEEIWKKDENKIQIAIESGFDVLVIWDNEYKKNRKETLDKCLDFLGIK